MGAKVIAFLVYPEITLLDLVGPLQVLSSLDGTSSEGDDPFQVVTVGERVEPMATDTGLHVQPQRTFDEVPEPFALILPGGLLSPFYAMANDTLMAYVQRAAEAATVVGSVCTGSLILAAAGLLAGRRATTHWSSLIQLAKLGAKPVQERWVEDGKFITAAGVSAGIDMALALAARLTDEKTARRIQLSLEYSPKPPFGDIDHSKVDAAAIMRRVEELDEKMLPVILASKPELLRRLLP
jgi:transcriptional regulator GlxA family with amidase domain